MITARLLYRLSYRNGVLAFRTATQEQQNCRDEDPVLGRYIPGSWMLTCVYLLSGRAAINFAGLEWLGMAWTCLGFILCHEKRLWPFGMACSIIEVLTHLQTLSKNNGFKGLLGRTHNFIDFSLRKVFR